MDVLCILSKTSHALLLRRGKRKFISCCFVTLNPMGASKRILRSDWLDEWGTDPDFPLKISVEFL